MSGFVWSTPPIEYAVLVMFVCGGASTWRSVCVRRGERRCGTAGAVPGGTWRTRRSRAAGRCCCRPGRSRRRPGRRCPGRRRGAVFRRCWREPWRSRPASAPARRVVGGFSRPGDRLLLPARLERRDDLRHRALLVLGEQHQPARHLRHAGQRGDPLRLRLRERQLRPGQEEVVHEVLARLAELRQVGEHRLVRLDHLARAAAAAARPGEAARCCCCGESVTVRSVPMLDSGFSAVFCAWSSPRGERHDRDHEADADREPEHGEDRPRLAAQQLVAEVREVEHPDGSNHRKVRTA